MAEPEKSEKPLHLPVPARPDGSIAAMANPTFTGTPPYTGAWAGCASDPDLPGPLYTPGAGPALRALAPRSRTRIAIEIVGLGS